jgi:hypothetical protein
MRPIVLTATATGNTSPAVVDYLNNPVNIGLSLGNTSTGNVLTAQYSLDDPFASYAVDYNTNGTWYNVSGLATITATTGVAGSITTPIRALRLSCTTFGSGNGSLTIVQSGSPGP